MLYRLRSSIIYVMLSLSAVAFTSLISHGQVAKPVNPTAPKVVLDGKSKGTKCKVTIEFASGVSENGYIILPFKSMLLRYQKEGKTIERKTSVRSLNQLYFRKWKNKRKRRRGTVFFNSHVTVVLTDGTIIKDHGPVKGLTRMEFLNKSIKKYVYTYFYDYWENKKWLNSGGDDIDFPTMNPHKNTVVKIRFYQKKPPIDKLLKLLMK